MTITHGILAGLGGFDDLLHQMNEIEENDATRENRKIDWNKTRVFDNSNRERSAKGMYERR